MKVRMIDMSLAKFINDKNNSSDDMEKVIEYITESYKTNDSKYIGTYGCSAKRVIRDFKAVKKINHKTNGKQYEHFVISLTPDNKRITDEKYMEIAERIAGHFQRFQSVFALHKDSDIRHIHFVMNSVSYKDGKKFSQGPADLNSFKNYCNHVLGEYDFDIIKTHPTELRIPSENGFDKGFNFLEITDDKPETRFNIELDYYENELLYGNNQKKPKFKIVTTGVTMKNDNDYTYSNNGCMPVQSPYIPPLPYTPTPPQYTPNSPYPCYLNYSDNITINVTSMNQFNQVIEAMNNSPIFLEEQKVANAEIDKYIIKNSDCKTSLYINRSRNITINLPDDSVSATVIDTD